VLVSHDVLGINNEFNPRFLRKYADLNAIITKAITSYIQDVKSLDFPNENECY
jgi:3-methyl-2-oxobutanoate hydroxymethyltransferase